jgi:hexosaminidase
MLLRNSFATFLFSALAASAAVTSVLRAQPQVLDVMPAPAEAKLSDGRIPVSPNLVVRLAGTPDGRLAAAIARASARWKARVGPSTGAPTELTVDCGGPGTAIVSPSEDESYTLDLAPSGMILRSPTALGAMHGLETLLQLLTHDAAGWFLPVVSIRDQPRFPWRGLMIDVARRWHPLDVIERNLDAMAVVKLNVLHLHLTDDQGFRIESRTHPELQAKGSDGLYFTQEQMRGIIAYAAQRGIRVVPEFDIPGHATSWVVSHPELASLPGPYGIERQWGVFNPVLDPTNEATYALLGDFLGEMAALFPDSEVHIGGDENNGVQWNANPRIQAFIRAKGLMDNAGLHAYFNGRIAALLAKNGKRLVGWDEILHPGLPAGSVIDSWRGTEALAAAAALGYDGILANGFYIDLMHPASEHYASDPVPASSPLAGPLRAHILGGEATMWSEWVTDETIDSRIWPRTAAIAERLWSPGNVKDTADMYRRLAFVSDRLEEAGSLHRRNSDVMLRHLVGENLGAPGVQALRTFLSLVEPVKVYARGGLQVWSNQLIPLVGVADAAQPESDRSREFADGVDRMLFAEEGIDRSKAGALAGQLREWGAAGTQVAESVWSDHPAVREAIPTARDLAQACSVGADALQALSAGTPLSSDALSKGLTTLDLAGLPNGSATELPLLRPIRLLLAAAARQDQRAGRSDDAWRSLLAATSAPTATAVH